MNLNDQGIESAENRREWSEKGYRLPEFDRRQVTANTRENPFWIHFGAGNIFRAFQANVVQNMLNKGELDRGLVVVEGYDYEIIEKIYRPHDDMNILVTLKADGNVEKTVVASIVESHILDVDNAEEQKRLAEIFEKDSLQMVSFTITEKGYQITDAKGALLPAIKKDLVVGPENAASYMGKVAALLYKRYLSGEKPIAMVSMDNCSHNGDKLYQAITAFADGWGSNGLTERGFAEYIRDCSKVSFPWTMIDKITPRPDASIEEILAKDGVAGQTPVITSGKTYIAPFVNAEECEYLVIEDSFPNGRPMLEKGGIMFTDRETVDKVEKMKVCTCLNPLHTTLAVYGCLLGYDKISEEMKDTELKKLVEVIGYKEGLPVVVNPGILDPKEFIDTVLNVRVPNPFMPDTPQRIATDTSQKLAIRFGETIKAYEASKELNVSDLKMIPLVFAGWLRYLMAIDDEGNSFTLSPDPLLTEVCPHVQKITLGMSEGVEDILRPILENERIFGVNLYEAGMAEIVCGYFKELNAGTGAVRATLKKYLETKEIAEKIHEYGVVPVVVINDAKDAKALADVLCEEGLPCAEVTFRTDAAKESIRIMAKEHPEMLVGAGTVLTVEQVDQAVEAGAKFIVSPGFDPEIVDYCISKNIAVFPGCVTPSEAAQALKRGLAVVKFFPAEQFGGVSTVKALAAPYTKLKFMPTGGVNKENLESYLSCDKVTACGGSWMVKKELIESGEFDKIRQMTKETVEMVAKIRSK